VRADDLPEHGGGERCCSGAAAGQEELVPKPVGDDECECRRGHAVTGQHLRTHRVVLLQRGDP